MVEMHQLQQNHYYKQRTDFISNMADQNCSIMENKKNKLVKLFKKYSTHMLIILHSHLCYSFMKIYIDQDTF